MTGGACCLIKNDLCKWSGPLRFKKNDVLGRADPSASRKTTFWGERTPPLEEKWRFGTSGPLRLKKNDVLGQADPSASRKMTIWDERTPPLEEKWRFRTSGPLRFKKNDDLGQADPSASRKMTFWDERTPPLQEKWWFSPGNFCKMGIFAYLPQWLWLLYISPKELEKSFFCLLNIAQDY